MVFARVASLAILGVLALGVHASALAQPHLTQNQVRLRYAQFDPLRELPHVPAAPRAGEGNELFLVQFVSTPLDEMRDEIRALGGVVERFLTENTHVIRMAPEVRGRVEALPYVRWVGPYHPAYRISEEVRADVLGGIARVATQSGGEPVAREP